ncbi:uncharacterized protein PAC_13134 [Phialocephala subalpina]|uniref:Zn(2)-C6 fungal-type domain-containing protein n=1 Tax=Phialocephala subalpina TaxID=576137 RepID=A0A1L7XE36_9HELO|nr:uncharacterized protein PAC_13134 [Phialocephala subalpina]
MFAVFEPNSAFPGPSPSGDVPRSQQPPVKPSRRRDKPQMSCTICRQKKLKCDRRKPCFNCTKRGQPGSCDYIKHDLSRPRPARPQGTTNVQDRVRQLEDMVMTLLDNQIISNQAVPTTEHSPSATSSGGPVTDGGFTQSAAQPPHNQIDTNLPKASSGHFTRVRDQTNFVGSEHWEAILEDITELRIDLETPDSSDLDDSKPQILFGMNHVSRSEIMSSIPSRPICDVLISRWFKTLDMAPMVVHVPTFMKEYDKMFKEPNETPLMWIGLLFSVLGLGSYFYAVSGEELHNMPEQFASTWEMSRLFRERTSQCLVEVNYLYPRRYTVETLCFYFAIERFQTKDSGFGTYVVLGIIVRVAMRLGYHRDASHYPSISPFEGEMRRRVWSMIFQLDLITSAQVGLPRMIREEETDTEEPKNLLDTDFDEGMTEVPHPRPSTDVTPVAYAIFMVRLLRQLGLIVDQSNSLIPPSYDEVMRLDSKLMETHATLPPYLTMRPLSLSITDDADLVMRRYSLEVCFQKSRCVLHRKYLIPDKSNPQFRYSRTASVDAAMKLLDVQCTFYEATQPGGQLFEEQWRSAALINQDYLLAAMILCLDLSRGMTSEEGLPLNYEGKIEATWPRNKRLQALKSSYDIWCKSSTISALAAKAAETLRVMLKDLESANSIGAVPTTLVSNPTSVSDATSASQQPAFIDQDFNVPYFVGSSATDFLAGMTDTEMNFDWPIPNNTNGDGGFRSINFSVTSPLRDLDRSPRFDSSCALDVSSYKSRGETPLHVLSKSESGELQHHLIDKVPRSSPNSISNLPALLGLSYRLG